MLAIVGMVFLLAGIYVVISYWRSPDSKRTDKQLDSDEQKYSL